MKPQLLSVFIAVLSTTLSAQVMFSDALNLSSTDWNAFPAAKGNGTLTFTAGGLVYQVSSGTGDDTGYRSLGTYGASTVVSWTAQVDVHLATFNSLANGQYINLNLILFKVGDTANSNATLAIDRYRSGSVVVTDIDTYLTVSGVETHFPELLNPTTDATLRYSYNAGTQQLSYEFDADGAVNGSSYVTISTRDISGWNLASTDSLGFVLVGGSNGTSVSASDAVFQNFSVNLTVVPESSTATLLATGLGGLFLVLGLRRLRR